MGVEPIVGLPDQRPVAALFATTRSIPRHQQDRRWRQIKGEGYLPFTTGRTKTQLLHMGVAGSLQRVHAGPPQLRSEPLEKTRQCQNLRLHLLGQRVELRFKRIANVNNPAQALNLACNSYDVKSIGDL
jgi:hypothetical protein